MNSSTLKILLPALVLLLLSPILHAQKDVEMITGEQANRITALLKPVKEKTDKLLADDATGTYKAYQQEISKMKDMKSASEKSAFARKLKDKYQSFFTGIWKKTEVDEKYYQMQIRSIVPPAIAKKLVFGDFLGFTVEVTKETPSSPPATSTPEQPKCVDVCPIAGGSITGDNYLIAGRGGGYGNCFVRASSWSVLAGESSLNSTLTNNILVPGTFKDDSRMLRVVQSYDMKIDVTAIAILGSSLAYGSFRTLKTVEYIQAFAPVLFIASKTVQRSVTENYTISKKDIATATVTCKAFTGSYVAVGPGVASCECNNIRWTVCEE